MLQRMAAMEDTIAALTAQVLENASPMRKKPDTRRTPPCTPDTLKVNMPNEAKPPDPGINNKNNPTDTSMEYKDATYSTGSQLDHE